MAKQDEAVNVGEPRDKSKATQSEQQKTFSPLAIVGIGCLFPRAASAGYFWANIKNGVDGIATIPASHWNPDHYFDPDPKSPDMTYARRGGFIAPVPFDPLEFGIPPRDIEATDTSQLLGLVAAKQALLDAGVIPTDLLRMNRNSTSEPTAQKLGRQVDRDRISVILGVTGALELVIPLGARLGHPRWKQAMKDAGIPAELADDAALRIGESYVPWQENSFPGLLGNVVAGRIANKLDLGGTNCVVDAACASSLGAVHLAALELQTGRADVVVSGGVDTFNDIFMFMCFSKTPALSASGDAKPFDAEGDGTILGEGLGVVVLKRLEDAQRDRDTIYAILRGIGSSSDGKGHAIYAPSAAGQVKCLRAAYAHAQVTPDTIELVEAHGTGTRVGDTAEITALTEVFGQHRTHSATAFAPWCAIGSVKSQIGHTKAAAGAASLIKAALALHYKVLPPTIKVAKPVEPLMAADSPFYVNTKARPWLSRGSHPRRAGVSAFGFGGSNFHAVLEEASTTKTETDWDGTIELVTISSSTTSDLIRQVEKLVKLSEESWELFEREAEATRTTFVSTHAFRLCFAAMQGSSDLPNRMARVLSELHRNPHSPSWNLGEQIFFGAGQHSGKVAVIFPGQGSQYVGMFRDLSCQFPEMLEALEQANQQLQGIRLSDFLYPPTSFDPESGNREREALRDTRVAQPGLGAVSWGAWQILHNRFGLNADIFAGHSYGELVALCASGRFGEEHLFEISQLRGELMGASRPGDPGSMLAVLHPRDVVENLLKENSLDLVLANHNSPSQVVLSGATAEIERARQIFTTKGLQSTQLQVAAAFHSQFVADAARPFREALEQIRFVPTKTPTYSNTTGREYPLDEREARDLLANQLARPVTFVDQILNMIESGTRTFIEVGPGTVLTRLTEAIAGRLGNSEVKSYPLDRSFGKKSNILDLAQLLAELSARGIDIHVRAWESGSRCRPPALPVRPGMVVNLSGANHVNERPIRPARAESNGYHAPEKTVRSKTVSNEFATLEKAELMPSDPTSPDALAQALAMTQQSLAALQRMQEQTAELHRQFLSSQEASQKTLQTLVDQQQSLLLSGLHFGASIPAPVQIPVVQTQSPIAKSQTSAQPFIQPVPPAPPPNFVTHSPTQTAATAPVSNPIEVDFVQEKPLAASDNPASKLKSDAIETALLEVVSEKTGYPISSLDLKLSLDNDLGVDSIKRVEILSALQEKLPSSPQVKPEHLGTLHTLQDVADFLRNGAKKEFIEEDELVRTMQIGKNDLILMARSDGQNQNLPKTSVSGPNTIDIASVLLSVVAEKTGYPVGSLDLKLSLDNDLGVDSIKRVEILSALQEKLPSAPQVKPEHLGTLNTLQDLADFLMHGQSSSPVLTEQPQSTWREQTSDQVEIAPDTEKLSTIRPAAESAIVSPLDQSAQRNASKPQLGSRSSDSGVRQSESRAANLNSDRIDRSILQTVDLELTTPRTKLTLIQGGEIWVVGDADPLTEAVVSEFAKLGFLSRAMSWAGPGANRTTLPMVGLVLLAPIHSDLDPRLNRLAFDWVQFAASKLRQAGRQGGALLASVARLDGAFGLNDLSVEADPIAGGLAGLIKTARHEWQEVSCKAIDLDPAFNEVNEAASTLVDELLTAGPVETGVAKTHRSALELARTVRRSGNQNLALGAKDVVFVTGGARGITAEGAVALAKTYNSTIVLTGRTMTPSPEPEWLKGLSAEAEIKKAIADHLGTQSAPKQIGEYYHKIIAQREVLQTLRRIEETGSRVAYYSLDVADGKAVADVLLQVRVKFGPVSAIIHGAGVLADKRIEDLSGEDFDRVYKTKVEGLRNLLDLLSNEELKAIVLFSSTTARLGRTGQAAYAVANEVLNKMAQVEARRRPGCRVVSINWGPWEGGMVTPGLRKQFENEGVGLIPLAEGASFMINELSAAGKAVEVLALAKVRPGSESIPVPRGYGVSGTSAATGSSPSLNSTPTSELILAFEKVLDVESQPVLRSHVIDGRAVLPMSLHLEFLAHAALHGHPGLVFHGFNDLRITQGIKLDIDDSTPIRAYAGKAIKQDKQFIVHVELRGKRKDGREQIKSRVEIVLVAALPKPPPADRPPVTKPYPLSIETIYRDQLFHGRDLQGIEQVTGVADLAFTGMANVAPPPADWFQYPLRSSWVADPLVLDCSFQMMILWTRYHHDAASLPNYAGRYRQFRRPFSDQPISVVLRVTRDNGVYARADIDYLDAEGNIVAQMQDYECMIEKGLNQAFARNQLGTVQA